MEGIHGIGAVFAQGVIEWSNQSFGGLEKAQIQIRSEQDEPGGKGVKIRVGEEVCRRQTKTAGFVKGSVRP